MTHDERRRYFRINETVGLSIQVIDEDTPSPNSPARSNPSSIDLITQHDDKIEKLILELNDSSPKIALLAALLNQKMERVSSLLLMESDLLDRIAHRVQEVNISACGIAFSHEKRLAENTRIKIELALQPEDENIELEGMVISCDPLNDGSDEFYCRVNFYGASSTTQEKLIQYIVQSQGAQLKARPRIEV